MVVNPNPATLAGLDPRTPTQIELATVRATIIAIESSPTGSATVGGQSFTTLNLEALRKTELILIERDKDERTKSDIRAGRGSRRQVNVRFVNV